MIDGMRDEARRLFEVAVAAADPQAAVRGAMAGLDLGSGRVFLLAVGKAAVPMAQAAMASRPGGFERVLIVTNAENAVEVAVEGAEVIVGGHPVPDAGSEAAARAVEALAAQAGEGDTVLVLVSGGGSALMAAPVDGLTLADKMAASRVMLGGGLDITRMNAVRQHLSRLKGGGLARAIAPARAIGLILSDVIGDDVRVIASGPLSARIASRAQAAGILRDAGLWEAVPGSVRAVLSRAAPEPAAPEAVVQLVGSNALSVRAMAAAGGAEIWSEALEGDVAEAARWIAARVRAAPAGPRVGVCGGETTVVLQGTGLGGRNQEMALRVAVELQGLDRPWAFLSGGTDGRDGPTQAAGGIVDGATLARIGAAGGDWRALLANNDSHAALALAGDLLMTGGTGTNVADVQVIVLG